MGIAMHFTLVDQAFFRFVYKFDRVFYRQDMVITLIVNIVDHGRQRSRFT
ncbi:hypothetical protein SDC9_207272 [bioreactor metagenome]|uniref:Uncharacterized protein n=1 Tax=bioreactor metagenome TaxID=1076179 RepID=A0A645J7F8_9ZZZZ